MVQAEKSWRHQRQIKWLLGLTLQNLSPGSSTRDPWSTIKSTSEYTSIEDQARRFIHIWGDTLTLWEKWSKHDYQNEPVYSQLEQCNNGSQATGHVKKMFDSCINSKQKLRKLFRNWEYVVLLRLRTLQGLYMLEPIDMHETFEPLDQFNRFMTRAPKEIDYVINRRTRMVGDVGMILQ